MDFKRPRPIVLLVLDGWGYSEDPNHNAIYEAKKPNWNALWKGSAHGVLRCSGLDVGLPPGQMGNSEVGHMNIGAGRVVYQDLTRITKAIDGGEFFLNPVLLRAIETVKSHHKALHILGLLSPGGVHSHEQHIYALIELAAKKGLKRVYLHAFLDGRDTPPQSALRSLTRAESLFESLQCGQVASLIGRYSAMDRDKRWDRTEAAYRLLVEGKAVYAAQSGQEGLRASYLRGETDEFVRATAIPLANGERITLEEGDVAVFMNFRADRARQLTYALTRPDFSGFKRESVPKLSSFITLTQYDGALPLPSVFAPLIVKNGLGAYLASLGLKQLRLAETEKYAHVTFFFNGGVEVPFGGEDRVLVPSPPVATYDLKPEMSVFLVTEKLVAAINSSQYDFILCNFANPDMVGHTGNYPATVKAIEAVDVCLGKIGGSLAARGGELVITADHGNAECMVDSATLQPHTAHTVGSVPFIYRGRGAVMARQEGVLADIAPTLLSRMGLKQPDEMTGRSLITL